ncbi:hypothetical protein BCR39DRAFT_529782 [Naematelia encephala]|uniref:Uncharacterized protein n=1 Tax=Naematelia encephala TaxID=71784 RepID=A0A1Y2B6F1_9TREE|nr:hypothetical protein BCR39DRAFT_529782 [Naematelia encephala]
MSMFSQGSFRPLKTEDTETQQSQPYRHRHSHQLSSDTDLQTPPGFGIEDHTSPFEEDDEVGELFADVGVSKEDSTADIHIPQPRLHTDLPRTSHPFLRDPTHSRRDSMERRSLSRSTSETSGLSIDHSGGLTVPPSPSRNARGNISPSRPFGLSALSPLQTFSPLQPKSTLDGAGFAGSSEGRRSRASSRGSLTRSLSRRQSLIDHAARWAVGDEYGDENYGSVSGLFTKSRLTLVKAPAEKKIGMQRSKSSSSLAPFSSTPVDVPATSNRGPRRSFAASSFAGFTPLSMTAGANTANTIRSPSLSASGQDSAHRISHLHSPHADPEGAQRKTLTPEEVVELSRSLMSPVVIPEGGFKGAELKRRKSSGAASRKSMEEEAKPPLALEPVEYVQLDDDTLLPFVDRPTEVTELVMHPSNEKWVRLLKAAFPKDVLRQHWKALKPEEWRWDELLAHLQVPRAECPDYAWVFRTRQAVRARSVALWEKLGTCLGCDDDLLNAGGEDGIPQSWGGLGLGEEGEYDPSMNHVVIEGIEAMDSEEREQMFREGFGEIVEDEGEMAEAGMTALLGIHSLSAIGEGDEKSLAGQTTAQRAASVGIQDPLASPSAQFRPMPHHTQSSAPPTKNRPSRSRSFVGLQILTSPQSQNSHLPRSPLATPNLSSSQGMMVEHERGPGSPLFPSSFSSLSMEPNLGRSASIGLAGGIKAANVGDGYGGAERAGWRGGVIRKPSGAGLSESAITFASESEWSSGAGHDGNF